MPSSRDLRYHLPRLLVATLFLVPLAWMLAVSLRQPGQPPPRSIEWLPSPVAWSNYREIFDLVPLTGYIGNSLLVVALAVPLTVVTASWAGFAMAQMPRMARRILVTIAVMLLMIPVNALWLTRFVIFKQLGLLDTVWALIAPALMGSSPLFVLLYFWTFRRIPAAMFESARLQGAGVAQVWAQIAMPMAWPTTFAVAALTFMHYWGDFVTPLLYIKSESRYTLPVGLQMLQQLDSTNWPLLMAGAVIMTAPILLLFLWIQRYLWPEYHRL